ncbi:MAG: ABC transporter permease [Candidatus Bathyarchaeota archaeon]|nr:ABC transporter permease [Candidatus Bathyarchaeota archaeon]
MSQNKTAPADVEETQVSKNRFHGLWALTHRDLKKWYQNPVVFILGIIQPVLWLALLGKAMNIGAIFSSASMPPMPQQLVATLTAQQQQLLSGWLGGLQSQIMTSTFNTGDYFSFMAMGMVAFVTVFTTAFTGMSVVWDRRLGFMNKVLSTPVARSTIVVSKVISAAIRSVFQAAIVTVIAYLLGLQLGANFTVFSVLGVFAIVFLIGIGLSSMFTAITLRTTRMETPQAIFNLVTLPLMFASSAYFPTNLMPSWLKAIADVNPISYTLDAVRRLMIFSNGYSGLVTDFVYVGAFAAVVTAICIVLSWRFLNK